MLNQDEYASFYELEWDSNYFGIKCAKAILHRKLTLKEWDQLTKKFSKYDFITIQNNNSEPPNSQYIGKFTNAFLADVNIQFSKKVKNFSYEFNNIVIHNKVKYNEQILGLADFPNSKFIEDPQLFKRGGSNVYREWIINSFNKENKYFAMSKDADNQINGFLLFSYSKEICLIELISVKDNVKNQKIGSKLLKCVENTAFKHGCEKINVGTQLRNVKAINFYQKNRCKQIGSHQVYHLWINY